MASAVRGSWRAMDVFREFIVVTPRFYPVSGRMKLIVGTLNCRLRYCRSAASTCRDCCEVRPTLIHEIMVVNTLLTRVYEILTFAPIATSLLSNEIFRVRAWDSAPHDAEIVRTFNGLHQWFPQQRLCWAP